MKVRQPRRATIDLPAGAHLATGPISHSYPIRTEFALSPDGKDLVFSVSPGGKRPRSSSWSGFPVPGTGAEGAATTLYRRSLDRDECEAIKGADDARQPFFSPDRKWVGFWANGKLYKIPLEGGIPKELALCPDLPMGAFWSDDGRIFLGGTTLSWIPDDGGSLRQLTALDPERDAQHTLPFVLPGGREVLFTAMPDNWGARARVEVVSLSTEVRKVLIDDAADARYISTGHLVFLRQGQLMAAPFKLENLELSGTAVPALAGVEQALNVGVGGEHSGAGQFSVSNSGTLVYGPGGVKHMAKTELVWVDRQGRVEVLAGFDKPDAANQVRLSPDGRHLAFIQQTGPLWLFDLERSTFTKLSPDGIAASPRWSPDGERLVFDWSAAGHSGIWLASIDGSALEPVADGKSGLSCSSWSRNGEFLALIKFDSGGGADIVVYRLKDRKVVPFLNTPSNEWYPEFSPDGRWLAYASDETGRFEVYLRSFPDGKCKLTVSSQGGLEPAWSRDGRELFYRSTNPPEIMKVDVDLGPKVSVGLPKKLFDFHFQWAGASRGYDLHPDGRRFLFTRERKPLQRVEITRLNLVQNWFKELERLLPER